MFKEIYIPFDNSDHSVRAMELGLELAAGNETAIIGSHVYAAKLHDWRFKAMESGLPEEFRKEAELERQRVVHDTLITNGLELITDSYLSVMAQRCSAENVDFRGVSLEGRNWEELAKDIGQQGYDLVAIGAHGIGRSPVSLIGTVCERVVRRIRTNVLVVRETQPVAVDAPIVVCLDGSRRSWAALNMALALGEKTDRPVEAISAFDPYFHYNVFESLKEALTTQAKQVFKFEQQERLHEEIIDTGLAKIYQSHLEVAANMARQQGKELATRLLDGKPMEKVLQYAQEKQPWLLMLGRVGIHGSEEMDLGGLTETMLRQAPCNLLIVDRQERAPDELVAEATTAWTEEGRARLEKAPPQVRGVAMAAIQRYAIAEGITMITSSVVDKALEQILPADARKVMGIGQPKPDETSPEQAGSFSLSYLCTGCDYVHPGKRPVICPVCGERGETFRVLSSAGEPPIEGAEAYTAFDGVTLYWEPGAWQLLEEMPDSFSRNRLRQKVEKRARSQHREMISRKLVSEMATQEPAIGAAPAGESTGKRATVLEDGARAGMKPKAGEEPPTNWTTEGWERLSRAPEGFMRDQARDIIEAYAQEIHVELIDFQVADDGMARAREKMAADSASADS